MTGRIWPSGAVFVLLVFTTVNAQEMSPSNVTETGPTATASHTSAPPEAGDPGTPEVNEAGHTRPVPPEPDRQVRYAELMARLVSGDIQLIDVRNRSEIAELGKIPGALNIPLHEFTRAMDMCPLEFLAIFDRPKPCVTDDNIIITCRTLRRSGIAMRAAVTMGYTKTRYYIGGWKGWTYTRKSLGLPVLGRRMPQAHHQHLHHHENGTAHDESMPHDHEDHEHYGHDHPHEHVNE